MSRVIRAADWQEEPKIINSPPPSIPKNEDGGVQLDEAGRLRMLSEIAEKEQRAQQMLKDAEIASSILKEEAQAECKRMREETEAALDEIRAQAAQEGHAEGLVSGKAEAEERLREELKDTIRKANQTAEKTLKDARYAIKSYVQEGEEQILSLAMQVVDKVLPQHFIDVPQVVLPLVQKVLEKVKDQKEIIIRVAPDSYDLVLMARDELRQYLTGGGAVLEVSSDESLCAGDCVIETTNGTVDARLATQIELIRNAVQEVIA